MFNVPAPTISQQVASATEACPTSVYLYYDRHDVLLYVGITGRGVTRQRQHNRDKPWWQFVTRQEVEHYPSRIGASSRERELIQQYQPPFNTQHNHHWMDTRAAYLGLVEAADADMSAHEMYRILKHRLPLITLRVRDSQGRLVLSTLPRHWTLAQWILPGQRSLIFDHGLPLGKILDTTISGSVTLLHVGTSARRVDEASVRLRMTKPNAPFDFEIVKVEARVETTRGLARTPGRRDRHAVTRPAVTG